MVYQKYRLRRGLPSCSTRYVIAVQAPLLSNSADILALVGGRPSKPTMTTAALTQSRSLFSG